MSFLLRAGLVIAVIFLLSPLRDAGGTKVERAEHPLDPAAALVEGAARAWGSLPEEAKRRGAAALAEAAADAAAPRMEPRETRPETRAEVTGSVANAGSGAVPAPPSRDTLLAADRRAPWRGEAARAR